MSLYPFATLDQWRLFPSSPDVADATVLAGSSLGGLPDFGY